MSAARTAPSLAAIVALLAVGGCGSDSSVVGGRCRDGLVLAGGTCLAQTDGPAAPAPLGPGAGASDGATTWAEGTVPEAGAATSQDGGIDRDAQAPPPPPPPPPRLACAAPRVACQGACIPVADDPTNCGACGKWCPSNLCADGECLGRLAGEVILIGHDFASAGAASPQSQLLINALTLPPTDPIRVLSWETGADAYDVAHVRALAEQQIRGRSVSVTVAADADMESPWLARSYDVVLVHDATGDDAAALGARWKRGLGAFVDKGGIVIALDGGRTDVPALLSSAALLEVSSHARLAALSRLSVSAPDDSIGARVISPYAASGSTVTFLGLDEADADVSVIVRAEDGGAVVAHRVVH